MKHLKLFFACMLMLVFGFGQVWATEYTHTFATSTQSISGDVCTVTVADGHPLSIIAEKNGGSNFASYAPFRLYNKNKMTISANSGYVITQVDISFSSAQNLTVATDAVDYSYESYSFVPKDGEGNAASCSTVSFTNGNSSQARIASVTITYQESGSTPTCATPTFNPAAGSYEGTQNVTISSTAGATIYYTTDGTDPTTSGTRQTYSTAIPVAADMTIKAYAVKTDYNDSEVATAAYEITEGPDVTIAFEGNSDWNIPAGSGNKTVDEGTYTDGTYTIKIAGSTGEGYYINGYLLLGKTGAYVELPEFSNPVEKIVIVGTSGGSTGVKFNIYDGTTAVSTEVTGCKNVSQEFEIADPAANKAYKVQVTSNANLQISAIKIFFGAAPAVAKPTISGDENFVTSTTVTISHADADHIYYTTDGTDPTTSSTEYTAPFVVNADGTTTVKAIAVKGSDESLVASKEFTKVSALSTMADVQSAATSTDETTINVAISNWVVTAVSGGQAWIAAPDNLKGILLYKSGHGFAAGNKLNGLVVGTKIKLYNDYPELTSLVAGDVAITTADAITARTTTIADLTSGHPAEQGTIVKLENLTYTASSTSFSDGANSIQIDSKLYSPALVDGASYTITGVVEYLASNVIKIMPRSVDDVEQTSGGGLPEVDGLAELKAEATGASYLVNLTDAVVTLVSGNNAFIEDATAGALIFYSGHGLVAGDKLNGQYEVTTATYQGKFEITAMEAQTGAEKTSGAEIPVTTLTIAQLNANFAANESKRIKIVGANVTDAISGSDRNGAINDGAALAVYAGVASTITLAENDNVDIIGYPGFHNSDQQLTVWAQADITVNEKADPELSYSPASVNLTVGDALSAPTFNNPHTLSPITYNTNNDAVATVDEFGAITLVGGTGTAVITASYAGDATYNAGNATFTINVYDPAAAPKNVVIIAEYNTKFYAMSTALNTTSNYCPAIEVEKDGGNIVVTSAEDKAAIQWSMAVDEGTTPKTASFQAGVDEYLKGTSSGAGLSFNATPFSWEWDDTNNCYIVSSSTRGFFYKNDGIFKNYALSNLTNAAYAGVEIIEIDPANIIISSKVSAELAYDPATLTITQGDAWSAPTLGYVVGFDGLAAITYASDNEAVATVTDAGVISLAGGTGTATITATFAGNANYLAGNATYAITVNAPAATPTGTTYTKVTSTAEITDGEYLIVYETTSVAFDGSLTTLDAEGNSVAVVISADQIAGTTVIDAATFTIDVTAGTLQSASGKYIGVSSNSNGLKTSDDAATYTNTFSIDGDGNAVILANFEGSTMKLRYNPSTSAGNLRFRYYKNDGQQAIQLYKKDVVTPPTPTPVEVRSGLEIGRHYTICLEKNITNIDGATFWNLQYKNAGNTEVYLVEETAPEAGKPYIIQATKTTLNVVYGDEEENTPVENGALRGTFTGFDVDAFAALTGNVYLLIENAIRPRTTGNYLAGHRAYVLFDELQNVPSEGFAPGKKVKAMPLQGQTPTGCENINASETPVKMIIDGQMFILRGEKMYDATGRLVK